MEFSSDYGSQPRWVQRTNGIKGYLTYLEDVFSVLEVDICLRDFAQQSFLAQKLRTLFTHSMQKYARPAMKKKYGSNFPLEFCVIHYLPIEQYPPLENLVSTIASNVDFRVHVFCSSINSARPESTRVSGSTVVNSYQYATESTWRRKLIFARKVLWECSSRRFDIVIGYGDEFSGLLSLLVNGYIRGLHLHELPPDIFLRNKYISKSQLLEVNLLKILIRRFSWVSQVTPKRADVFADRFGVSCLNLYNFPIDSFFDSEKIEKKYNNKLQVVYVGSCNPVSVETNFLQEFALSDSVDLAVLPTNDEGLNSLLQIGGFKVLNKVPYRELPSLLSKFDLGLVLYNDHSNNMKFGVPNKLVEYLKSGLHVAFCSGLESINSFVAEYDLSGFVHELPHDAHEISELIERLLELRESRLLPWPKELTFETEYEKMFSQLVNSVSDKIHR